jgi:hypothetical protein
MAMTTSPQAGLHAGADDEATLSLSDKPDAGSHPTPEAWQFLTDIAAGAGLLTDMPGNGRCHGAGPVLGRPGLKRSHPALLVGQG